MTEDRERKGEVKEQKPIGYDGEVAHEVLNCLEDLLQTYSLTKEQVVTGIQDAFESIGESYFVTQEEWDRLAGTGGVNIG